MLFDFASVDLKAKGELYHSVYEAVKKAVECGALKKGERLPSIREASTQLGVSRTTVENAYTQLCIEGIAESRPQIGYYIIGKKTVPIIEEMAEKPKNTEILYDFSSRKIDTDYADTEVWKKLVRGVLLNSEELTSYGDPQGEFGLRLALSSYSYKARGVIANPQNIIIGAGMGPLLNILCGLLEKDITVGFENGGFSKAENIFSDYGINHKNLPSDNSGALIESMSEDEVDLLFLLPSALSKISITALAKRRNEILNWAKAKENRLIVEDDYNGELRYTARSVPAFQGKATDKTVYIGSFSKLLLPSVRIAYMVLPDFLVEKFNNRANGYNQTCSKTDQLALKEYILKGALEKHLKKLRRLYYSKSQLLYSELKNALKEKCDFILYESSLTLELITDLNISSKEICRMAEKNGIKLIETKETGRVRFCFAGIKAEQIPDAVKKFKEIF